MNPTQNEQAIYSCDTLAGQAHLGKLDVHTRADQPTNKHRANNAGIVAATVANECWGSVLHPL
jgi:hypothetical protein